MRFGLGDCFLVVVLLLLACDLKRDVRVKVKGSLGWDCCFAVVLLLFRCCCSSSVRPSPGWRTGTGSDPSTEVALPVGTEGFGLCFSSWEGAGRGSRLHPGCSFPTEGCEAVGKLGMSRELSPGAHQAWHCPLTQQTLPELPCREGSAPGLSSAGSIPIPKEREPTMETQLRPSHSTEPQTELRETHRDP